MIVNFLMVCLLWTLRSVRGSELITHEPNFKNPLLFKWCGIPGEWIDRQWDLPAVIAGDASFPVKLVPGNVQCEEVTEVTLDLNRIAPVAKRIVYNEDFWSRGYFRFRNDYYHRKEFCISGLNESSTTVRFCSETRCGLDNPCIPKCCPLNKLVTTQMNNGKRASGCGFAHDGSADFRPRLYKQPFSMLRTTKEFHYKRTPINCPNSGIQILPHATNEAAIAMYGFHGLCYRVRPDGTLMYRDINYEWSEVPPGSYCLDGFQYAANETKFGGGEQDYGVLMCGIPANNKTNPKLYSAIYGTALVSSSMFLLITFVVYLLLWSQHSVHGWTTLCHSSSMFFMYLFLGMVHLSRLSPDESIHRTRGCELIGILAHFFFVTSFCWFTVINFDLFWTFRGISISRSGSKGTRRFVMYATFAYGLPTIIVLTSVILDYMYRGEPCNMFPIPAYGLLRKCYMDSAAMGPYMYYPVGFLLMMDLIFFLVTSYKLYEYKKSTRMATQNMNNKQQLFTLISKLFFVMGFTWIFEFVSWYHSGDEMKWYWIIFDVINCLQAVAIFIVYVCKPDILRSLVNAYPVLKPYLTCVAQCFRIAPLGADVNNSATFTTSGGESLRAKNQVSRSVRKSSMKT